jgi:hypothetical protein
MFRSRYYLIGILIGVLICAGAGRVASSHGSFRNFSRFFILIQPQDSFFPTLSRLIATAKSLATPDKTLVLVGSNSIFRGTGQNPDDLWTLDLQRRLGKEYVVLNYAIDQANMTSFAGVAFRALRDLYPKILFVSLAEIRGASPVDGDNPYQYLFWDGYYKGLLHLNADEEDAAANTRSAEIPTTDGIEIHVGSWLDSLLYFKDLWSHIGYNYFFTIWNIHTAATPFAPRASYVDATDPNIKNIQVRQAADIAAINLSVERMSHLIGSIRIERDSGWQQLRRTYTTAFSDEWRPRILLVMLRINPDYLSRMSEADRITYDSITIEQGNTLRSLGYRTIDVGADWVADDFMDIGHLSARGGSKLSEAITQEVNALSAEQINRR